MPRALETLIMEDDAVTGIFRGNQLLQRRLVFAGDRRCRRAYGNIRHGAQPMVLVRGHASQ
jgi:hypothetical protein